MYYHWLKVGILYPSSPFDYYIYSLRLTRDLKDEYTHTHPKRLVRPGISRILAAYFYFIKRQPTHSIASVLKFGGHIHNSK